MVDTEEFDPMNTRWGYITFKAHVCECHVFEDFINIFLPVLTTNTHYIYSVEEDDTPNRHIHAVFALGKENGICKPEIDKINQKFNNKFMKQFKKSLGIKQTQWKVCWYPELVKDTKEDFLRVVGYCLKDDLKNTRSRVKNIPTTFLTQATKFQIASARIEADSVIKNDIKIITSKNFHVSCEAYAKKNNMTVHDWELIPKMTHDRHSFQISARDLKKYEAELLFMNSEYDIKSEHIKQIMDYKNEVKTNDDDLYLHNSSLMKIINDNNLDHLVPAWINNKYA